MNIVYRYKINIILRYEINSLNFEIPLPFIFHMEPIEKLMVFEKIDKKDKSSLNSV